MSRPVTIALVWHQMNSVNLGVGALTLANLALCREAAREAGREARFLVLGWRDKRDWYETPEDVENIPVRIRGLAIKAHTQPLQQFTTARACRRQYQRHIGHIS